MESKVAGVDDAGRGSVLGPLVIAAVSVRESSLKELVEIGIKDSKLLSPVGRERLYPRIIDMAEEVSVIRISPREIDEYVIKGKKYKRLNYLEAMSMAKVIERVHADLVYVDASDIDPERFKQDICSAMSKKVEIISAHHADRIYPVVSAASIVAKITRDHEIVSLAKFGSFGSGYPSDERTINFLRKWLDEKGDLPFFVRKSWKTLQRLHGHKMHHQLRVE